MTPERKAYLMDQYKKEATIRRLIRCYKGELKHYKAVCNSYDLKVLGRKPFSYRIYVDRIKEIKLMLNLLRHELARLKGMDRVVVPKPVGYKELEWYCKCGEEVIDFDTYCSYCGRRILWEKVSK